MQMARGSARTPRKLSESLLHHLDLYALAAGAAGVSLLALTPAAEAKIVYTKTHQVIGYGGIYDLDLNHDGIVDFVIQEIGYSTNSTFIFRSRRWLFAKPALGNGVAGEGYASALKAGAVIGPRAPFIKGGSNGATMVFVSEVYITSRHYTTLGDWINVKNRYLGLKFKINGKFHYGWARLNAQVGHRSIAGTLTGYAYETVANRSIRAGQTEDGSPADAMSSEAATPVSDAAPGATLGTLALGAQRIPSRR